MGWVLDRPPPPDCRQDSMPLVCLLVTKPAMKRKEGQFLKGHFRRDTGLKQEAFGLDAGKDFLNLNEQLVERRFVPLHRDGGLDERGLGEPH